MSASEFPEVVDYQQALAMRDDAARRLFAAELALHDAHQTYVDEWVRAASDRLHDAVLRHLAAEDRVRRMTPAGGATLTSVG